MGGGAFPIFLEELQILSGNVFGNQKSSKGCMGQMLGAPPGMNPGVPEVMGGGSIVLKFGPKTLKIESLDYQNRIQRPRFTPVGFPIKVFFKIEDVFIFLMCLTIFGVLFGIGGCRE